MMVPAVTEVCLPQGAHSQVHALVCSGQALPAPQAGQTNPSGQRAANRYRTQAASSGKRLWNSIRECGKSDMSGPGRAYGISLFYHPPTFFTTANGGPGGTEISLFPRMEQGFSAPNQGAGVGETEIFAAALLQRDRVLAVSL